MLTGYYDLGLDDESMTTEGRATANIEKHVRSALEFLEHADREFAAGDQQQGSEKLWGAVSQASLAVGKQRRWRCGKSSHRRGIARNLAEQYGEPLIASHYGIAEKFHANFYHDFMEEEEIEEDQPMVRQLVHRLIEIVEDYTPDTES